METHEYVGLIVTLLVAFLPSIPGIRAYREQKRLALANANKTDAEAAEVITGAASTAVGLLRAEMVELKKNYLEVCQELKALKADYAEVLERDAQRQLQVQECMDANTMLREWNMLLSAQVVELGGTPCPEPATISSKPITKPRRN